MVMRAAQLFFEITSGLEGETVPTPEYLISEYNTVIRRLSLILPESDSVLEVRAVDGEIVTELSAEQIRRVVSGSGELLRASDTLRALLPSGRLYTPHDGKISVTENGDFKVFYRSIPKELDLENYMNEEFPLDGCYIPLVRAYMWYKTYLYLGDGEAADKAFLEYERFFAEYRSENGVR